MGIRHDAAVKYHHYDRSTGFVVRKSSILGAGPIVVTAFRGLAGASSEGPASPQGVDNYDPAATEGYFIGASNVALGHLVLRRVSTPGGTPTISANIPITIPSTQYPITVPHKGNTKGTNGYLDALDDRLFAAHLRNGRLWTAHNIEVNSLGVATAGGGRNGSRWYEIQNLNATPSVVQSGTVFDSAATNPKSYWIPSLMVSGQGHVAMGFSTANASAGAQTITLTNPDGQALTSAAGILTLTLPLTPIQIWHQLHFATTLNTGSAANTADPNTNGIVNLTEYALAGDPLGTTTGTTILPYSGRSADNHLQILFTRHTDRSDLILTVQAADSLTGPWTDLAQSSSGEAFISLVSDATATETGTDTARGVSVTDIYQVTDISRPQRFMRLKIANTD